MFEPPVQALMEMYRGFQQRPPFDPATIPEARRRMSAGVRDRTVAEGVSVVDIQAGGVPVRLYRPAGSKPLPLHLFLHGGAFIFGSALSGEYDGLLSRRALEADCVVASVEYRLAPEHRFPAGLEDCHAALLGLCEKATALLIADQAVTIGGVSSGGNFAAVLALMVKARGGPSIAMQLMEIAGTDLTKCSTAWRNPGPGHDTTRERDVVMIDLYLNSHAERAHPWASPLFAPDLSGLPPAYVMNAEFDPRRDECEAYVARLGDAGVSALARTLRGHVHGSSFITGWPPADAFQAEANAALAMAHRLALAGRAVTLADLEGVAGV